LESVADTPVEDTIIISGGIVTISQTQLSPILSFLPLASHFIGVDSFTYQWQKWDEATAIWIDIAGAKHRYSG